MCSLYKVSAAWLQLAFVLQHNLLVLKNGYKLPVSRRQDLHSTPLKSWQWTGQLLHSSWEARCELITHWCPEWLEGLEYLLKKITHKSCTTEGLHTVTDRAFCIWDLFCFFVCLFILGGFFWRGRGGGEGGNYHYYYYCSSSFPGSYSIKLMGTCKSNKLLLLKCCLHLDRSIDNTSYTVTKMKLIYMNILFNNYFLLHAMVNKTVIQYKNVAQMVHV